MATKVKEKGGKREKWEKENSGPPQYSRAMFMKSSKHQNLVAQKAKEEEEEEAKIQNPNLAGLKVRDELKVKTRHAEER